MSGRMSSLKSRVKLLRRANLPYDWKLAGATNGIDDALACLDDNRAQEPYDASMKRGSRKGWAFTR